MSLESPNGKTVIKFLNELDANICKSTLHDARNPLIFEDNKPSDSHKRKATDSFDLPYKEKKRSPSPQRLSDWEFFRMKEQIVSYKMEISQLESRLRSQGEMRVKSEVEAAREIKRLENERMSDRSELKQLHYLTDRLRQSLAEQEEQMNEALKKSESEKSLAESKYITIQGETYKLKDAMKEVEEARDGLTQQVSSAKADVARVAKELEEEKIKQAKLEYSFRKRIRDATFAQKELEAKAINAERMVQNLTQERDLLSESLKEVKSTAAWVIKEAELEKELKKAKLEVKSLRDAVQDKFLLEECNNSLQEKVSSLEGLLKNSAEVEAAKNELVYKLKDWQSLAELMCSATGIVAEGKGQTEEEEYEFNLVTARKALSIMQMKEAELTSELLEAQSKIKELQSYKSTAATGAESLKAQIKSLTSEKAEVTSLLEIARRKIKLVSQERDNYRQLLDSMEQDMTLSGGLFNAAVAGGQKNQPGGVMGGAKGSRVEELEQVIHKYQKNMETLEAELAEEKKQRKVLEASNVELACGKFSEEDMLKRIKEAVNEEKSKLEKELEVVWREKEEGSKEIVRLNARVEQLEGEMEHRALKGDFNAKDTKVVHFKMNPAALASKKYFDELEVYRSECDRLRERVKLLEEKHQLLKDRAQSSSALNMEVEFFPCDNSNPLEVTKVVEARLQAQGSKEIEELREQLRLAKLLPERLKEAFKMKIKDFRDACYNLFGYKLKLLGLGRCSLYSMYAESPEDHLLFEISPSGMPSLLETPFSATLGDLITIHLRRQHSFPAFLSAVTLDLFNRQTMA